MPLEPLLPRYLLAGGLPETALADDLGLAQRLLREDIVDRVLKRDMTARYGVRNVLDLERLFAYLCLHTGSVLALDAQGKRALKPRPKIYMAHPALRNAVLLKGEEGTSTRTSTPCGRASDIGGTAQAPGKWTWW